MSNFINPYNFIPLTGKKTVAKETDEKGYTGVIEYSLLTKTPLFIPNTSSADALKVGVEGHKSYDFFSYEDLSLTEGSLKKKAPIPVIPGSEIRGMLRSNYEILTNSCLFAVDDGLISKRTNEVFKPGLIRKGENSYDLYKAEDCIRQEGKEPNLGKAYKTSIYMEGEKVYVSVRRHDSGKPVVDRISKVEFPRSREGYVIKGEDSPGGRNSKRYLHIMCTVINGMLYKNVSVEVLDAVLSEYKSNKVSKYTEYAKQWSAFKTDASEGEYFPVYYSYTDEGCTDNTHIMLSPACITREIYKNKLSDMIKSHKKCDDKDSLCPACALFGTLGNGISNMSKVRFSDLKCMSEQSTEELFHEPITLAPLATPKINNMEFYYKRPAKNAWFWTADYWIDNDAKVHKYVPEINGRKFYWHQPEMRLDGNQKAGNLNVTIRPLKKNVVFSGKMYFENIDKQQLDELLYLFEAGDANDLIEKKHGYKLGAAKPLGYGSVALHVERVLLRTVERDEKQKLIDIKEQEYLDYAEPKIDTEIKNNFCIMTDFYAVEKKNISYPKISYSDNIFEWFGKNHAGYSKKRDGTMCPIRRPKSRKQMVYKEYMEPMSPELKSTGFKCDSDGGNYKSSSGNSHYKGNYNGRGKNY